MYIPKIFFDLVDRFSCGVHLESLLSQPVTSKFTLECREGRGLLHSMDMS